MENGRAVQPLRIALLRGDDYHNLYLDSLLRADFEVVLTVVEPGRFQRHALYVRSKTKDALAAEYHRFRRKVLGLDRYRRRFFGELQSSGSPADPEIITNSINSAETLTALATAAADICVITCTTMLSRETILAANCPIINIHGGHLPDYRGCHCFFFALYEGNYDKIGSTIHYVNAGLDTGDIIEVVRPSISTEDTAESLYCKAESKAARRLISILHDRESGVEITSHPQEFRGRLILRRNRLPHHDLIFGLRRRFNRVQLPNVADGATWIRNARAQHY